MSTTIITTVTGAEPQTQAKATRSLARTTIGIGLVAAAGVTALAAVMHAAGVSVDVAGEIPLPAFAQFTFIGAVIGGVLAAVFNRRSAAPRRRFVQTTSVLLALSCVPSVTLPSDIATKLALVTTHLAAAAIIVPVLARRVND